MNKSFKLETKLGFWPDCFSPACMLLYSMVLAVSNFIETVYSKMPNSLVIAVAKMNSSADHIALELPKLGLAYRCSHP